MDSGRTFLNLINPRSGGSVDSPLIWACMAETLGTFVLVLFGIGSVAAAVYTGAQVGLWQVAAVWGFGVTVAIYISSAVSGAHLNPAVSLAFAIFRSDQFPINRLFAYWGSQLVGAIVAGVLVLILFNPFIDRYEAEQEIIRGEIGSEKSAMAFGEYFPNPAMFDTMTFSISPIHAFAVEAFGTAILVLVIFALTDKRNAGIPTNGMVPFFIGFTVAALISLFAPITQAGWNPARDFGPRIVAWFAGWGEIAIPGPETGFWVYILGPLVGAPIGALLFKLVIEPGLPDGEKEITEITRSRYE